MGAPLKYHWSNPKFEGLPWPAESKPKHAAPKKSRCVKIAYSMDAAKKETAKLRSESRRSIWFYKWCGNCQGYHVCRG